MTFIMLQFIIYFLIEFKNVPCLQKFCHNKHGWIKLIKSDIKDMYNVAKNKSVSNIYAVLTSSMF